MNREFEQAITAEVENWEGASVSFEMGGVHPKAKLVFGELIQKRSFPGTPGDRRALHNTLADMRRTLRGMGATRGKDATTEEDEAVAEKVYNPPNDGRAKRQPAQGEPATPAKDVADQLLAAGVTALDKLGGAAEAVFGVGADLLERGEAAQARTAASGVPLVATQEEPRTRS